jgi:hypothetical protein
MHEREIFFNKPDLIAEEKGRLSQYRGHVFSTTGAEGNKR